MAATEIIRIYQKEKQWFDSQEMGTPAQWVSKLIDFYEQYRNAVNNDVEQWK